MTPPGALRSVAGRWNLVPLGRRLQARGGRLRRIAGLARRAGAPGRIALALVAGGLLVGAALIGGQTPLQASAPGPGIRLVDLSDYPTHTTVDRFEVEVSNLTATVAYQVIVSSDSAGLGIGACGTASQTETVTGVTAQALRPSSSTPARWATAARSRRRCAPAGPARGRGDGQPASERGGDPRRGAGGCARSDAERGAGGHARDRVGDPLRHRHGHGVPGEVEPAQRRRGRLDRLRDPAVDGPRPERQAGLWQCHHHRRPDHLRGKQDPKTGTDV